MSQFGREVTNALSAFGTVYGHLKQSAHDAYYDWKMKHDPDYIASQQMQNAGYNPSYYLGAIQTSPLPALPQAYQGGGVVDDDQSTTSYIDPGGRIWSQESVDAGAILNKMPADELVYRLGFKRLSKPIPEPGGNTDSSAPAAAPAAASDTSLERLQAVPPPPAPNRLGAAIDTAGAAGRAILGAVPRVGTAGPVMDPSRLSSLPQETPSDAEGAQLGEKFKERQRQLGKPLRDVGGGMHTALDAAWQAGKEAGVHIGRAIQTGVNQVRTTTADPYSYGAPASTSPIPPPGASDISSLPQSDPDAPAPAPTPGPTSASAQQPPPQTGADMLRDLSRVVPPSSPTGPAPPAGTSVAPVGGGAAAAAARAVQPPPNFRAAATPSRAAGPDTSVIGPVMTRGGQPIVGMPAQGAPAQGAPAQGAPAQAAPAQAAPAQAAGPAIPGGTGATTAAPPQGAPAQAVPAKGAIDTRLPLTDRRRTAAYDPTNAQDQAEAKARGSYVEVPHEIAAGARKEADTAINGAAHFGQWVSRQEGDSGVAPHPHSIRDRIALNAGVGAMPVAQAQQAYKDYSYGGKLTPGQALVRYMTIKYQVLANAGQTAKANQMAFEVVQRLNLEAAQYGNAAAQQIRAGNQSGAIGALLKAHDMTPDGTRLAVAKDGRSAVMLDEYTNRPLTQPFAMTPKFILAMSTGLADGTALWDHLLGRANLHVQGMKGFDRDAEGRQLRNEATKLRIDILKQRRDKGVGGRAAPAVDPNYARFKDLQGAPLPRAPRPAQGGGDDTGVMNEEPQTPQASEPVYYPAYAEED